MLSNDPKRLVPVSAIRGFSRVGEKATPREFVDAMAPLCALPHFQDAFLLEDATATDRCTRCDNARPANANKLLFGLLLDACLRESPFPINVSPLYKAVINAPALRAGASKCPPSTWTGKQQQHHLAILLETLSLCRICDVPEHCTDEEDAIICRPISAFESGAPAGKEVQVARDACRCGAPGSIRHEPMAPSGSSHACVLEVPVEAKDDVVVQDALDAWARRSVSCRACGGKTVERRRLVSTPPTLAVLFVLPDGKPAPVMPLNEEWCLPFCLRSSRSFTVPVVDPKDSEKREKFRIGAVGKRVNLEKTVQVHPRPRTTAHYKMRGTKPDGKRGWFFADVLDWTTRCFVRVESTRTTTVTDELALASTKLVQIDYLIGSPAEAGAPASDDVVVPALTRPPRKDKVGTLNEFVGPYKAARWDHELGEYKPFRNVSAPTGSGYLQVEFKNLEPATRAALLTVWSRVRNELQMDTGKKTNEGKVRFLFFSFGRKIGKRGERERGERERERKKERAISIRGARAKKKKKKKEDENNKKLTTFSPPQRIIPRRASSSSPSCVSPTPSSPGGSATSHTSLCSLTKRGAPPGRSTPRKKKRGPATAAMANRPVASVSLLRTTAARTCTASRSRT